MKLSDLLTQRRLQLLQRWAQRIQTAHAPGTLERGELWDHLPLFLDELLDALRRDEGLAAVSPLPGTSRTASQHGQQRLRVGFDVDEVVREYAILGECILDEVEAVGGALTTQEQRVLLRCLWTGTAEAVGAYVRRRDEERRREAAEHVAFISHELRNPLTTALVALAMLRRTALASGGPLVEALERGLTRVRDLVDDVLTAERLAIGVDLHREPLELRELLADAESEAAAEAEHKGVPVRVESEGGLTLEGDRRLLRSAITNLVRNAVKFTPPGGSVTVRGSGAGGRVVLEVEDRCGGLPPGKTTADELFQPYVQRGRDRSGFGLGLAITRQAVDAHGGTITVRNLPGVGCVFRLELPASSAASAAAPGPASPGADAEPAHGSRPARYAS